MDHISIGTGLKCRYKEGVVIKRCPYREVQLQLILLLYIIENAKELVQKLTTAIILPDDGQIN